MSYVPSEEVLETFMPCMQAFAELLGNMSEESRNARLKYFEECASDPEKLAESDARNE